MTSTFFKITGCIFIAFYLSSCVAYQYGELSAGTNIDKNFIYEDMAIGVASSSRFLGLGGIRKDALLLEAKRQLITSRPLLVNEEYGNFTYDFKRAFFLGIDRTKVTMSADVLQLTTNTPLDRYSELYKRKVFLKNQIDTLFSIADTVLHVSGEEMSILSKVSKNRFKTLRTNKHGEFVSRNYSGNRLFSTKADYKGAKPGDIVSYTIEYKKGPQIRQLIAVGRKHLLFKTTDEIETTEKVKNIIQYEKLESTKMPEE